MKKTKGTRKPLRKKSKNPIQLRNLTGSAVKRIRMSLVPKVTQEDMVGRLARQGLSFSQGMVAKMENGHRPISDFELVAIARALRVSVQVIVDLALKG